MNDISPQIVTDDHGQSPFDAICRTRPDGTEYWSARDLQQVTEYSRWEDFAKLVERARTSAANTGIDADQAFTAITEKGSGRPRAEFHLTRYAAYLTVMNGDPNMPRIAEAQAYFAIRTRQAETAQPALTDDEIVHQALVVTTKRVEALGQLAGRLATTVAEQTPKVEAYDAFMEADGSYGMDAAAKILGWGPIIMRRELRKLGVLRRNNLPYQRYEHHFNVVPQVYTKPDGTKVPTATTYVLPSGLDFLRKKLAGVELADEPVQIAALPIAESEIVR